MGRSANNAIKKTKFKSDRSLSLVYCPNKISFLHCVTDPEGVISAPLSNTRSSVLAVLSTQWTVTVRVGMRSSNQTVR